VDVWRGLGLGCRNGVFMKTSRMLCLALMIASLTSVPGKASPQADKARDDANTFPPGDPAQLGVDVAALMRLKEKAEAEGSDAVVVVKDGKLIADWDFGKERGPIHAMSATKSVVSLAIGRLIDEGKITLDQPVSDFFPEWKQGRKQLITVRHLLNHTSGLEDKATSGEIYNSPDFVQFALAADLVSDPGSKFFYSNKATNLLAGVVRRGSGQPLDEYVKREIFEPLGIKDFMWSKDPAGNPHGLAGLHIRAIDFARIGQLMLDEGVWRGRRIVSKEWVAQSISPGQPHNPKCGLLWWLTPESTNLTLDDDFIRDLKTRLGLSEATVKKLEALKGKPIKPQDLWPGLFQVFGADENLRGKLNEVNEKIKANPPAAKEISEGAPIAFSAVGYLGQYVVVIPRHRIVAVRQRRAQGKQDPKDYRNEFGDFEVMVRALVK
jgi:CubicO group peptidase (beta-lactamase class C family)